MSRKLHYGIKVSKRGFNVIDLEQDRKIVKNADSSFHLRYALALPYLQGAKKQIARYQHVATNLEKKPRESVIECIHEASILFEDLCTISKYAEKCGDKHELHELWLDVRNHIRHDIREELDKENDSRKNKRAQRLKINDKLQTSLSFSLESIQVGGVDITMEEIVSYLMWADKVITNVIKKAKENGQVT